MEMARHEKIAQALKKELSIIIHDEIKDPRLGFVTVTGIELAQDLRFAKVFYSVLGKEEDYKKTKDALDSSLGFIRRLIGQRIRLRFVPELLFKEDRSYVYSVKVEEILNQIKEENEPKKSNRANKKAQ